MAAVAKNMSFQISEGYRAARRTTSILCAIALAWVAAQFDFKTVSLGYLGGVDLSQASISLVLFCAIAYTSVRLVFEYAMQSVEIRRWKFAQADFELSVFLIRAAILMLAASGLDRSIETVLYIALAVLAVLVGSEIFIGVVGFALMPLLIYIRLRQGRTSIASRAIESFAWAELIVYIALVAMLIGIGVASLQYEPLRSLWSVPPSPTALGIFILASVAMVVSRKTMHVWCRRLFATPPVCIEHRLPDGVIQVTFPLKTQDVWDWYSQPINVEQVEK